MKISILLVELSKLLLFIQIARLRKFSTQIEKNSLFPLTQSIKVYRRAPFLLPSLFPAIAVKNPQENVAFLIIWSCNVTTYTREPTTPARKIVLYHRSTWILRHTVSFPDYGSWFRFTQVFSRFQQGFGVEETCLMLISSSSNFSCLLNTLGQNYQSGLKDDSFFKLTLKNSGRVLCHGLLVIKREMIS